jgi:ADP-ribosylglycohydrolase
MRDYLAHRYFDTAPFALWAAARNIDDDEQVIWITAGTGGDVDTTCAIVGGIVAAHVGVERLPSVWRAESEPLPAWAGAVDNAQPV